MNDNTADEHMTTGLIRAYEIAYNVLFGEVEPT